MKKRGYKKRKSTKTGLNNHDSAIREGKHGSKILGKRMLKKQQMQQIQEIKEALNE